MPSPSSSHESLYARLFARLYDPVMHRFEEEFMGEKRRELLQRTSGKVLEVGAGTGANIPHYPKGVEVLAIEPSHAMLRYARNKLEEQPSFQGQVHFLEAGIEERQVQEQVPEEGFDYIVCTLVLCTVPQLPEAIQRMKAWLKPGGQLLTIEHIQDSRQPQRWLQNVATPLWKQLAEGCHLNRPTDQLLKEAGFVALEEQYFYLGVPFYWAVMEKK